MVILDTCALLEICKEQTTIGNKTLAQIREGAYILSVSFAEIACKIAIGKLVIDISVETLHKNICLTSAFNIVAIGVREWLDSVDLAWKENRDPVDRLITAFAMRHEIPIVSSDGKIKKFYKNVLW